MRLRALAIAAAAAGMMAVPQIAQAAWWGYATGNVNMRTCASVSCAKITVVPRGARVWVDGSTGGWYHLSYAGRQGYASGRYIARGSYPPPVVQRPPPPAFGYCRSPWWDSRYGAWYDGCRWYHQRNWYGHPSGFFFGFSFGR